MTPLVTVQPTTREQLLRVLRAALDPCGPMAGLDAPVLVVLPSHDLA